MEKLNIAEILRHCPKGMELYSTVHGKMNLEGVFTLIHCKSKDNNCSLFFYPDGRWIENRGECILFPSKENRDWSTFQRPFKDGDVLYAKDEGNEYILILKEIDEEGRVYCYLNLKGDDLRIQEVWLTDYNPTHRLATLEEKEKLFKAIKDNGYRWDSRTKTLEKLIEPKFKVGDKIKCRGGEIVYRVVHITEDSYVLDNLCSIPISIEHMYNLVPNKFDITTLKPFESRVLVRGSNDDIWKPAIWGIYNDIYCSAYPYITTYGATRQCIPYEDNQHLLGTTNDCDDFYKTWE